MPYKATQVTRGEQKGFIGEVTQKALVGPGQDWYGIELDSATYGTIRPSKAWQVLVRVGRATW